MTVAKSRYPATDVIIGEVAKPGSGEKINVGHAQTRTYQPVRTKNHQRQGKLACHFSTTDNQMVPRRQSPHRLGTRQHRQLRPAPGSSTKSKLARINSKPVFENFSHKQPLNIPPKATMLFNNCPAVLPGRSRISQLKSHRWE